ncbi:probable galactinol--sucrose galactosyltransferase 2 [Phragmites australis]|uniref:probable galactinol--sucrose galactosyltransferase 2 n=1 Tax=Phragmites australis TaxID=29695 RepID=UPI002D793D46|nr:probable galactinol--sucrose galactosyltransferase 2 [Phragmites australis]
MAMTRLMLTSRCSLRPSSPQYKNSPHASPAAQCRQPPSTVTPPSRKMAQLEHGSLLVGGRELLARVPPNVSLRPAGVKDADTALRAAFVGAKADAPSSRHVFSIGTLVKGWRWLSLFRFKIWWMVPATGAGAAGVPAETQMLLLESRSGDEAGSAEAEGSAMYALMLPVLDSGFRASLQGSPEDELQFCFESGDPKVQTMEADDAVFINSGDNPFKLMKESIKMLSKIKGTFNHIEDKEIPPILDWFGWCTWDAFYKAVNPVGIEEGLKSLCEGGAPPRFLIIDDGWQETINEFDDEALLEQTVFAERLIDLKENHKFRGEACKNLGNLIKKIKETHGVKYVYMWHALPGYWGGVLATSDVMKKYNPKLVYPVQSPGNVANLRDIAMDSLEKFGLGIIDPANIYEFYNDQHSYLSSVGVDGVKVDVQNVLETLGRGLGGRVALTRKYQQALEESVTQNFKRNNLICCMSHNSDSIFSALKSAVARASEDFMPQEPTRQTLHIASVAFNSFLLGEIFIPDWDMFHSKHESAEFHGAARALSGGGVYVSDKPGVHNFNILKKLVLPDGSILRARYAGRPTRDCLFNDPVMDGKSLLKIWNLNNFSGVIGVFNCQGAGQWVWPVKEIAYAPTNIDITGHLLPSDVDSLEEIACGNWNGETAVYAFNSCCLSRLQKHQSLEVSLSTMTFEIYTISPIRVFSEAVQFAPLGLINMFNSGGALDDVSSTADSSASTVHIKCRGPGRFGAYSATRPELCRVDEEEVEFSYTEDGLLAFDLPYRSSHNNLRHIEVLYRAS